ncbi:MAG TPA: LysR family transcriptional regulator [Candidatus Cybelea sp.]|nr:LysR family transcriptional regulator [Candidatus Cybelea sp.]
MHASVLRYVDHVARFGSIRRAAEALNVASSAVNRQILRLEAEMGVPLFERQRNGVRPTAAGEALLRHVRETQTDFQRVKAEIASLGGVISGEVRIVSLESLLVRFLPLVVQEVRAKHPEVTFTVLNVDPSEIGEALRSGETDFGLLFADMRQRDVEVLAEIRTAVGALMRPDHPLARRSRLTLTECADYPVVMLHDRWLLDAIMTTEFATSGARLSPGIVSNSIEFMRHIIAAGLGIGFFTPIGFIEEIRRGELVHVPLAEPGLSDSRIGILAQKSKRLSPPARLVIGHIRDRLNEFAKELSAPPVAKRRRRRA